MLTVKRGETTEKNSNVMSLERDNSVISGYKIFDEEISAQETEEQIHERKAKYLERLLNYEKYSTVQEDVEDYAVLDETEEVDNLELTKEDLLPSSTTLQFEGENSVEKFQKRENYVSKGIRSTGKLLIVAYCVLVSIVMALIIVNTGIINSLDSTSTQKQEMLEDIKGQYMSVISEIDYTNSEEFIVKTAEEAYNMVK